ncbi:unnamed protein product [Porites evermanni]|uniref:Large ribosomal subunit protein mL37 n=1 Tax=Porites evermanni TaxID=104178 RepID=A0ABN8RYI4_9CNID|nr:unnamed protein product [Porites evermanni]
MAANLLEKRVASKLLFIRHTTLLIRRKFCAVAVQEENEGHQTGIPLIIAPHVIRRAFIVHPSTKEINASLKYQWFTKTKLYEGLPSSLSDVDRYFPVEEYEVVKEPFRNSVLQNYGFRKEATNDRKNERSQGLLKLGVMQDLLRFGWSFADRYPHLNDCFLDFEPKIKIHWVRHHNFYQLEHKRPKPAYIIRAKEPAPLFEPDIERTCLEDLPGPFDNYSLGVYRHPIVHLQNNPGFQNTALNKYPYNHMLFLTNTFNLTYEQQQAFGIMSMFSSLVSLAMNDGVQMGQHLEKPLVTKCAITDGIQFTFMCYQLNTLSLQEDSGIKNCAWSSPSMTLFTKQEKTAARLWSVLYESLGRTDEVAGINDECFKTFLAFLCQN